MDYMDKDFGKILKNNAQTLRHDLLPKGTDCFRVYDRNLSRYPVTVDLYGKLAKVTDYGQEEMAGDVKEKCLDICSRMLYLEPENVVYSYRARRPERQQHEKTGSEALKTVVHENGLSFSVDLTSYTDTGLFLDHAVTRQMIRERSANADVLNLFSYTGSFSVYAASGLAASVTSVDMSATYTKWAKENLEQNGYAGDMYRCVCMDATEFVRQAVEKGSKYDIIIFDPPSFSNSRKMEDDFDVARDYAVWIKALLRILKKTGFILFSTNLGSFRMDRRRLRGLGVREITGTTGAPGFVKGRAGTVRSWIMAFDDETLSLNWSEPEEKKERKESAEKSGRSSSREREGGYRKEGERRTYRDGSRDRNYGERREGRDHRDGERNYGERRYGDGEKREYRGNRDSGRTYKRDYNRDNERDGERRPYRSYGERDYDRPQRRYDDKPYTRRRDDDGERSFDRPRREYGDRPSYDRNREGRDFREHKDRDFKDRDSRERRYGDGEKREFRGSRDNNREFSRDRSFRERDNGSRREQKPENRERRDFGSKKGTRKPYGYDSFKPARSREDSSDFFWNEEDLDKDNK